MDDIIRKLGLKDVELLGPFLEDEGLRAFEYWGGEYHPLEELLEDARRERERLTREPGAGEKTEVCIAEFQRWTRDTDAATQWNLLTTPQLLAHLTEEIGEVAQSVNRIYAYTTGEEKERQLANLKIELVEAFWFLVKIANKFDIDLDAEVEGFVDHADEWLDKYHGRLVRGLKSLDRELSAAKDALDL